LLPISPTNSLTQPQTALLISTYTKSGQMSNGQSEVVPHFSQPVIFWGVIGTLATLVIGLMLTLVRLHPRSWSYIRDTWTQWRISPQELHEDDPRQSFNLPIQTPPPPVPPRPTSPIPIPKRKPSRSFDTFGERPPIRIHNVDQFRKPTNQQHRPIVGQG